MIIAYLNSTTYGTLLETNENYTEIKSLDKGKEIIVRYTPGRGIRLKVLGNDRYKVLGHSM